ncbi:MAG: tetratricopeptide repeat protein [Luteolibacter sp.]|uniref:tetratricopeptide repeat protein n=1 Tax=Luteolibacter sp. TaxID=1962973 RepID=UPI0032643A90
MKKFISLAVACTLVSQVIAQTPAQAPAPTSDSLLKQGQAAEKAGDPVAAKEFYTKSLKMNPNNANAIYSIGQLKVNSASIAAKGREAKFGAVVVPVFQLDAASLQEALDALSVVIEKESKQTVTPNFIIQDPKLVLADRKITLNLKNMPSKAVMKYLMDQTGAKARYDEHAVVVTPL